jgi:endonuclease/exonuclease/phosphatase family metal-dependent hydrolase
MQQEIRFATFNGFNLAPPGVKLYDNLEPLTAADYEAKLNWTARQLDQLDADVIGFQEVFSQDVLREVLARSRHYRNAWHAGFDQGPERLVPNVALVSRLPLAGPAVSYAAFPDGVALPPGSSDANRFARAPLHAQVVLPDQRLVDVLVVHLKSKRPDYHSGDNDSDPLLYALANLRSLIRRGTEAVALRMLLTGLGRPATVRPASAPVVAPRPRIVLGDFNDVADAVTTTIVLGGSPSSLAEEVPTDRFFDSHQIQLRRDAGADRGYTNIHNGHHETIDHILVSEEFNPASRHAIGEVLDVTYLNAHLLEPWPGASDHGQVLARVRLYDAPPSLQ